MVLDENGNIKLWYLPGAINHIHQVINSQYLNIARYSNTSKKNVWDSLNILRSPLEKSAKKSRKRGWRKDQVLFRKTADLMGSIDLLPAWHQQGHRAAPRLSPQSIKTIKVSWNAVYSSVSIMVNRATPYHTDMNGREQWLDMLVTVGDYLPLDFVIPTFELRFRYNPGTIIAMSGSALEHGVGYTTEIVDNHKPG
ncbi:hypothetical protein EDC04DRAFT_2615967 [Pisolithus marmoratus]|nr:hypothetical protein EDC04DRAFT_2615967 [Pisolithus marmoratus]